MKVLLMFHTAITGYGCSSAAEPGPIILCCSAHFCCQILSGRFDHNTMHTKICLVQIW